MRPNATPTVLALNARWRELRDSPQLRRRITLWHATATAIDDVDPDELVAAAAGRRPGARDCPTLDALVGLAQSDGLALQVVMRAMLRRWVSIMGTVHTPRLSHDEIASLVVSIGTETILECRPTTASTPTDYRLWSDTRRRVHRHLADHRPAGEVVIDPHVLDRVLDRGATPDVAPGLESSIDQLTDWIVARTDVPRATAALMAATRAGLLTLHEAAATTGVSYDTVARRRSRAEQQLRAALQPC